MGKDNHLRNDAVVYIGAVAIVIGSLILLSQLIGMAR